MPPYQEISKFALTMKLIELTFSTTCMGLNVVASSNVKEGFILTCIVYGGYIIIFSGLITGILFKERVPRLVDMFFSLLGMTLFVAAGYMNLSYFSTHVHYQPTLKKYGLTAGALSIVNAFFLLLDAAITFKCVHDYTPH